jgi:hypothetical protein
MLVTVVHNSPDPGVPGATLAAKFSATNNTTFTNLHYLEKHILSESFVVLVNKQTLLQYGHHPTS